MGKNCKGCTKRFVGCHSTCEIYLENKKLHDSKKQSIYEAKNKEQIYNEYLSYTRNRIQRRIGKI